MLMDVDDQENNNDRHTSQHLTLAHAHAPDGRRQPQRTDAGDRDTRSEYDDDGFQLREGEGRDALSASASAGASDKTVTATSASPFRPLEEGAGQRRLSIRDLLDTSHPHINTNGNTNGNGNGNTNGRPGLHSAHSSPGSTGTTASSPRYWNWPVPPSSSAGAGTTFNGIANANAYTNGSGAESPRTHSPVPFPPPRSRAPSKRPVPISTGSSPFPYSSVRNSARASASPYPPQATPVGLGIRMDASTSASVAASPSPSGEREHNSHSSPGPSPAAVAAGFSSPGGGSLSTNRRGVRPAWPSPKKRDARSQSFGQPHHTQPGSSLLTPREWYDRTPTVLRVPPSAHLQSPAFGPHLHSPSTPVSVPGSAGGPARRPASGWPANSAPAGAARRVHLTDVPKSKVINALNSKAAEYWFSPQTSDCRIYVPVSRKRTGGSKAADSDMSGQDSSPDSAMGDGPRGSLWPPTPGVPAHIDVSGEKEKMNVVNSHGRSGAGRRGSMPNEQDVPVLVFPLHRDYLIIQSTLLRTLLSNSSIDMVLRTSPTRPSFASPRATSPVPAPGSATGTPQARSFPTPRPGPGAHMKERSLKGARVLPAKDGEPVSVFLPLPDPASFGVILHWLYWGDVGSLEQALSRGLVTWQGIVKNIEYLSMDDSIKRVMGKWWRTWVKTDVGRATGSRGDGDGDRGRGVSVSASSDSGDGSDLDDPGADGDDEGMGMQVDTRRGEDDEDGVSHLLKNL